MDGEPLSIVERLREATNAHDLEALVDCFSDDYRNDTPAHPGRSFEGRSQVRANWTQIFAAVPDVTAEVTASVVSGDVVWSEWEMKGNRRDGVAHLMRGVIIFDTADEAITSARSISSRWTATSRMPTKLFVGSCPTVPAGRKLATDDRRRRR